MRDVVFVCGIVVAGFALYAFFRECLR